MSDLAQRLRLNATIPMVMEAADRIEALRAALHRIANFPYVGEKAAQQMALIATAALASEQDK